MSSTQSSSHNFWPVRILAVLIVAGLVGSMAFAEIQTQLNMKRDLEDRFALRADTASTFLTAYINNTLEREEKLATLRLGSPTVSHDQFLDFLDDFEFGPSMLLDENGYLLDNAPNKPELIGTKISNQYTHLQIAVNGQANVSNVVPSAELQYPVVAFSTPFESQVGTRIISGAFDLTTQPLGNYLRNALPYGDKGAIFLIDENNKVIVSGFGEIQKTQHFDSDNKTNSTKTLSEVDKGFTNITLTNNRGHYTSHKVTPAFFVSKKIDNSPWRIVISVKNSALYEPVRGNNTFLPWIFISSFAIVASILAIMIIRGRERRLRLQDVALIDLLTGIYNPRGLKSHLSRLFSGARRHETDLTICLIDIDDFSIINNRYGSAAGDNVLINIAQHIQQNVRAEDIIGRWGGEEFLMVLPDTDIPGAEIVAERVRLSIHDNLHIDETDETVSISVGITSRLQDDTVETLIMRSTEALQEAKTTGKNKISSK